MVSHFRIFGSYLGEEEKKEEAKEEVKEKRRKAGTTGDYAVSYESDRSSC